MRKCSFFAVFSLLLCLFSSSVFAEGLHANTVSGAPSGSYIEQTCVGTGCPQQQDNINSLSLSQKSDLFEMLTADRENLFLLICDKSQKFEIKSLPDCSSKVKVIREICQDYDESEENAYIIIPDFLWDFWRLHQKLVDNDCYPKK